MAIKWQQNWKSQIKTVWKDNSRVCKYDGHLNMQIYSLFEEVIYMIIDKVSQFLFTVYNKHKNR